MLETKTMGKLCNILGISGFGWYKWVYFRHKGTQYPFALELLGCALGLAQHAGNVMSQHVLLQNGIVLPIQTL